MFDEKEIPIVAAEGDTVVTPQSYAPVEESEQQVEVIAEEVVQPEQKPPQDEEQMKRFKAVRDKAERMERERDEALRKAQAYEQMMAQKQNPQLEEEDVFKINDDDLVEGKHLSAQNKRIKKIQEENKRYQEQLRLQQEQLVETQIRMQYPDFDKVVNPENLRALQEKSPALALALRNIGDLKSQASSAYELIKQFGIDSAPSYTEEKELVAKNAAKPKSRASISTQRNDSPVYQANAFANGRIDDQTKARLWKEMQECAQNRD